MKALGVICGVGSMLIGAKKQGWKILGNIEGRPYYDTGTFEFNFPGSFYKKTLLDLSPEQLKSCEDLDLIIGHTECGSFSNLRVNKNDKIDAGDMGDIPVFIDAVKTLKPKFFAMDNLPKSLTVANWKYYALNLPDYDIHLEYVSNWGYGNLQKFRNRLFVIGSKKDLNFYFIPSEVVHSDTIKDRLSLISDSALNNDSLDLDSIIQPFGRYNFDPLYSDLPRSENIMTIREFQEEIKDLPLGNFIVLNKKGEYTTKIGKCKIDVNKYAQTLTGEGCAFDGQYRNDTLMPFTIRERAKIQGCPDEFTFIPVGIDTQNKEYLKLLKQTGKFMPVEFTTFLTKQIMVFLNDERHESTYSGKRVIKSNPLIDNNKQLYCHFIEYNNQKKVCEFCGSKCKNELK